MGVLLKRSEYGVAISKYVCAMLRCRTLVSLHSIDKQGLLPQLEKDSFICKTAMWQTCDMLACAVIDAAYTGLCRHVGPFRPVGPFCKLLN